MTTRRFYPAFSCKDGFEEKYVVMDGGTKPPHAISGPLSYHTANERADAMNKGCFVADADVTAAMMEAWVASWNAPRPIRILDPEVVAWAAIQGMSDALIWGEASTEISGVSVYVKSEPDSELEYRWTSNG